MPEAITKQEVTAIPSKTEAPKQQHLKLNATIGFSGQVTNGYIRHPGGQHAVYPIGSTVVIKELTTNKQYFLNEHSNVITCMALSKSGKYIASGQLTYMGFQVIFFLDE